MNDSSAKAFAPYLGSAKSVFSQLTVGTALLGALSFILCYAIAKIIYNVYFHPLAKYPAPFYVSASMGWWVYHTVKGDMAYRVKDLHDRYGAIVRINPADLSFADARAWRDIYEQRPSADVPELGKDPSFYRAIRGVISDRITTARWEDHARMRKKMAPAFSQRAIRDQEPLIKGHVDMLISQLKKRSGQELDVSAWCNFATFDIIGDLAFGEPFGCLESAEYSDWVRLIMIFAKLGISLQAAGRMPLVYPLVFLFAFPRDVMRERHTHLQRTIEKATRRIQRVTDRQDFMQFMMAPGSVTMSHQELVSNSSTLIVAGSETSATTLAGMLYFLSKDAPRMRKLVDEVRSAFKSELEIDLTSVGSLPYLKACIDESLRIFPPTPNGLPRRTPKKGVAIAGQWIPGDTGVSVPGWTMGHSKQYFRDADEYIPERWLNDTRYAGDDLTSVQPFSAGPRNCLGQSLAHAEIKLIMARLIWNFDFELSPKSDGWALHQKSYLILERPPLWMTVMTREGVAAE